MRFVRFAHYTALPLRYSVNCATCVLLRRPRSLVQTLTSFGHKKTRHKGGLSSVQSERLDLNQRPLRPERSALSKLSYAPCHDVTVGQPGGAERGVYRARLARQAPRAKSARSGGL